MVPPTENDIAWFRAFYAFGEIILCWWDHRTHIYRVLTKQDERKYNLQKLRPTLMIIRKICRLDFFSSEIALDSEGKFIVVDYVNEICDMRPQSKYFDGVPIEVISTIQIKCAKFTRALIKKSA